MHAPTLNEACSIHTAYLVLLKLLHTVAKLPAGRAGTCACLLKQLGQNGSTDCSSASPLAFLPIPCSLSHEAFPPALCTWGIYLLSYVLAFAGASSLAGNGEDLTHRDGGGRKWTSEKIERNSCLNWKAGLSIQTAQLYLGSCDNRRWGVEEVELVKSSKNLFRSFWWCTLGISVLNWIFHFN